MQQRERGGAFNASLRRPCRGMQQRGGGRAHDNSISRQCRGGSTVWQRGRDREQQRERRTKSGGGRSRARGQSVPRGQRESLSNNIFETNLQSRDLNWVISAMHQMDAL